MIFPRIRSIRLAIGWLMKPGSEDDNDMLNLVDKVEDIKNVKLMTI